MNPGPKEIARGIFAVGGPDITQSRDAYAYLVEDQGDLALVDAGAGPGAEGIIQNIRKSGNDPSRLKYLIATHAHIDHVGGFSALAGEFEPQIVAHALDAPALESGDSEFSAASWYGLDLVPVEVNLKIKGESHTLVLGTTELQCLWIPGHTPGSMAVHLDRDGDRVLFGQDIHGPFHPSFSSNLVDWRRSMQLLLALEADVLAEGHYGIYRGRSSVTRFINKFLKEY